MTKALAVLIVLLMVIQIIKPLGFRGLKRRADFWKIGLGAVALIVLTVAIRPGG